MGIFLLILTADLAFGKRRRLSWSRREELQLCQDKFGQNVSVSCLMIWVALDHGPVTSWGRKPAKRSVVYFLHWRSHRAIGCVFCFSCRPHFLWRSASLYQQKIDEHQVHAAMLMPPFDMQARFVCRLRADLGQ